MLNRPTFGGHIKLESRIFHLHKIFYSAIKGANISPFNLYAYSEYNDVSIFFKKYF